MIAAALEAEMEPYLKRLRGERDAHGRAVAVRNGQAQGRPVTLDAHMAAVQEMVERLLR